MKEKPDIDCHLLLVTSIFQQLITAEDQIIYNTKGFFRTALENTHSSWFDMASAKHISVISCHLKAYYFCRMSGAYYELAGSFTSFETICKGCNWIVPLDERSLHPANYFENTGK